jgi:hypothetical protein
MFKELEVERKKEKRFMHMLVTMTYDHKLFILPTSGGYVVYRELKLMLR